MVQPEDGLLGEWCAASREFGVGPVPEALARHEGGLDHLGVPPGTLCLGDPPGGLPVDAEQLLARAQTEVAGDVQLQQGNDRHLVLAQQVVR